MKFEVHARHSKQADKIDVLLLMSIGDWASALVKVEGTGSPVTLLKACDKARRDGRTVAYSR